MLELLSFMLCLMFFLAAVFLFSVADLLKNEEGGEMKNSHRSELLDLFIGQEVRVTFFDDSWNEGILCWKEKFEPPLYLKPKYYYITDARGGYIAFRKSHVKSIEKI